MREQLRDTTLARVLSDILSDAGDLVRQEIQLARAELSEKFLSQVRASVWFVIGALLGLIALSMIAHGIVFAIASYGVPMHWAFLMVAAVCVLAGACSFFKGRSTAKNLVPERTIHQIKQDVAAAREQVT